jgi:hypothetical protein
MILTQKFTSKLKKTADYLGLITNCNLAWEAYIILPRCSHTWKRAPISEHRADYSVS